MSPSSGDYYDWQISASNTVPSHNMGSTGFDYNSSGVTGYSGYGSGAGHTHVSPAPSSTIYPCGHSVQYVGSAPPAACPACGRPHQWSGMGLETAQAWTNGNSTQEEWVKKMKSEFEAFPSKIFPSKPKEPTLRDWLDHEIDKVRELAFS